MYPPSVQTLQRFNVIEAHGYGMRYKSMMVSIHVAKVQVVKNFDHRGLYQAVTKLKNSERLVLIYSNGDVRMAGV